MTVPLIAPLIPPRGSPRSPGIETVSAHRRSADYMCAECNVRECGIGHVP
jgi:hypothetical protein